MKNWRFRLLCQQGLGISAIFISVSEGFSSDLISYLFGSVSAVSRQDLWIVVSIAIIVILFLSLFFKEFFVLSFDEEYAKASGLPAKWIHILFMIVTALVIAGSCELLGFYLFLL